MPTYTFRDLKTGEETTSYMSIAELDKFLRKNKHLEQVIGAPAIGDTVRLGMRKPDNSFRDHLKEMKKKHSRGFSKSTINTF
jgi:hypothetical protein